MLLLMLLMLPGKERLATRIAAHSAAVLLLLKAAKVLRRWQPERTGHCRQQAAGRVAAKAKVGKLSARQLRAGKLHAGDNIFIVISIIVLSIIVLSINVLSINVLSIIVLSITVRHFVHFCECF
jgi:hypothetical protein